MMINTRWLAAALLGLLSTIAQADETLPRLAISAADLGASDQPQITTAVFADFLNDAGWCQAEAIKAGPGSRWHTPPAAAPPERWVSVATCGYHHRADAYALMFGEGGELTLCAHAAAHKLQSRTGAMLWTQPLAPLASNLKVALRKAELARRDRDRSNNRPKLAIRLVEDTSKPAADSTPRGQLDEAVTLPPEKVLPGIELMALATACEAGFAPTRGEAEQTATLEVAVRDRGCAFRLTLDRAGKKVVLQQQAGWQEYHDVLLRMFQMLRAPEQLADFTRPDRESLQLLASSGQRLFAIVDDELTAIDLSTGGEVWRLRIPQVKIAGAIKKVEQYTVRYRGEQPELYRYSRAIARYALEDGKEQLLAPTSPSTAWGFDVAEDGTTAVAVQGKLSCFRSSKPAWQAEEPAGLTCGPVIDEDRVLVGTASGELLAFSLSDGKPLWRQRLSGQLFGRIVKVDSYVSILSADKAVLHVVDPSTGKPVWQSELGDMLLAPPISVAGQLILATKANQIRALDPATGSLTAEARWPTWLLSVKAAQVAGQPALVCTDLDGQVSVLDAKSLKVLSQVRLPNRLAHGLVVIDSLRTRWPRTEGRPKDEILATIADSNAPLATVALVNDVSGFLYLVSLQGSK